MKNLTNFILETFNIDDEMITESFKSSVMRQISKQINKIIDKNHDKNAESDYVSSWYTLSGNFKDIFRFNNFYLWSEFTDDDFKEYDASSQEAQKLIKRMTTNRSNSFPGLIILLNDRFDDPDLKYEAMIICNGQNYYLSLINNYSFQFDVLRSKDVLEKLNKRILIGDITGKSAYDIQVQRNKNKSGSELLLTDKDTRERTYAQIMKANKERYAKYVAKIKAERDDKIAEKVNEYVNKIMELTTDMVKNPTKYIGKESDINYVIDLLSDKRKYHTGDRSNNWQSYYTGVDGLLPVYKEYIKYRVKMSKGNADEYERKYYKQAQQKLDSIFKTIDEGLKNIKSTE